MANRPRVDFGHDKSADYMNKQPRRLVDELSPRTRAACRLATCWQAERQMKQLQQALRTVGAKDAAAYIARARKSIQGAIRHAEKLAAAVELTEPTR